MRHLFVTETHKDRRNTGQSQRFFILVLFCYMFRPKHRAVMRQKVSNRVAM